MSESSETQRSIIRFWLPLLATWLLMASEGPVVAAMIARLAEPTLNLAAYGVAIAFALILEAPIIMMMSAAIALVRDRASYLQLRRYAFGLNALVLLSALIFLATPLFSWIARDLVGLPSDVAERVHRAGWLLLPWPAAIGFRRFYQGVMVSSGATRQITAGTVVRLSTMVGSCLILANAQKHIDGATIGAFALSMGVVTEAAVARFLARQAIARTLAAADEGPALNFTRFWRFYYPLMITSFLALAIQPLVTFFVGRARLPVESLAVLPVLNAIGFIFRTFSLSMQDVVVALGPRVARVELRRFARRIACVLGLFMGIFAWTPLANLWLAQVTGLSAELASVALVPLRILILNPFFGVILSYCTANAITNHRTIAVTVASLVEVTVIALVLWLGVGPWALSGVLVATIALAAGRMTGAGYLLIDLLRREAVQPVSLAPLTADGSQG